MFYFEGLIMARGNSNLSHICFFSSKILRLLFCMSVCMLCVCSCRRKPEECFGFPRTAVINNCHLPHVGARNQLESFGRATKAFFFFFHTNILTVYLNSYILKILFTLHPDLSSPPSFPSSLTLLPTFFHFLPSLLRGGSPAWHMKSHQD